MKKKAITASLLVALADSVFAIAHYVDLNCANSTPPYTNWGTAAKTIQDAVDAAAVGDEVVVTNGIYATGGRAVGTNLLANRVAVDKPVALRSVSGPQFTVIQGLHVSNTTNGDGAIRCVFLTNGASLFGFTLTNGGTRADGYEDPDGRGGGVSCDTTNAVISNCAIVGNSAFSHGGGAYGGTLNNCLLSGNSGYFGGAAAASTVKGCMLADNRAYQGGGAYQASLNNCTLSSNSAFSGGGAWESTLNNCLISSNNAANDSGGAWGCTLNNSAIIGNSARGGGGGWGCMMTNCTVIGNSAYALGGVTDCTLQNSIVYFNTEYLNVYGSDTSNWEDCSLNWSCTLPLPEGAGNISSDPQLADQFHLSAGSPCRASGNSAYAKGTDLDGEPWASPPSMGCDEYHPEEITGSLSVSIQTTYSYVASGAALEFLAMIEGHASANSWDFGDGSSASNQISPSHSWPTVGDYIVVLKAFNQSNPGGISATTVVHVVEHPIHYVALTSLNPTPPYLSWATAAANIQDAIDAAIPGAQLILVSNGVYQTGGRRLDWFPSVENRICVTKPVSIRSLNGPETTVIQGDWRTPTRCAYLADGASLIGFTLTGGTLYDYNNLEDTSGGGVFCGSTNALVRDCIITGNSARGGGGASGGRFENCTISGNYANGSGGGVVAVAAPAFLTRCTLAGNTASDDGGGAAALGSGLYLERCTFQENVAGARGGGVHVTHVEPGSYSIRNCSFAGNSATQGGGASGAFEGFGTPNRIHLYNCTLVENSAATGGGVWLADLYNSLVYFNSASVGANYDIDSTLSFCCTVPLPPGAGNTSSEPQLADSVHLSATSPCRAAGSTDHATGTDIDGEPWASPPSIGCDEYYPGGSGVLQVVLTADHTNVATGFTVNIRGTILGHATSNYWDFGNGASATGGVPFVSHAWRNPGDYVVTLLAYNDTTPAGIGASVLIHVTVEAVHYVSAANTNPVPPYTSWATAATNIQDAVDAASVPGAVILVSDGDYTSGARSVDSVNYNRVLVDKPVVLRSVNGPKATIVNGMGSSRCAYLSNGASLIGFTLTNGVADSGAGIFCSSNTETVSDCVIAGNVAGDPYNSGDFNGGGVGGGTLINCTLITNTAYGSGGGAFGSMLNNCTLADNQAPDGGGATYCTLDTCTLAENSASRQGGGALRSTLTRCALTGNSAVFDGGGASDSTLHNCTLTGNAADDGGGASGGTLNNSSLFGNLAGDSGGGSSYSELNSCTITGNSAGWNGGGASGGTLNNCTLVRNVVTPNPEGGGYGGGADSATLNNCAVLGNKALIGGGASWSTLNNCTLTGNSAVYGGGASSSTLNNCIVYFNTARMDGDNYDSSALNYCCSSPWAPGIGNIGAQPQLADSYHLSAGSPCRGAGSAAYSAGSDIDGESWANPPSIGCDEFRAGFDTGPLVVSIMANYTNAAPGFSLIFMAQIDGHATSSLWDFGDQTYWTNQPLGATHAFTAPGDYTVTFWAFNDTWPYPVGVSATLVIHIQTATHFVSGASTNPTPPYASWATAATNIQDAVDVAAVPGALVLVTNGTYATGGRAVGTNQLVNRIAVTKPLRLESVNGPSVTVIQGRQVPGTTNGDGAVRCAYLTNGAALSGFTLTFGGTRTNGDYAQEQSGGGVWCESHEGLVSNCWVLGNSAAINGGGVFRGTIHTSNLMGNSASSGGGGHRTLCWRTVCS